MTGAWVFVVGPSGVGKDSVINAAQQLLPSKKHIVFARRLVTRPSDGGALHDAVSSQAYRELASSGALCWQWQAHGFCYGIAASYLAAVRAGQLVVVNGSRAHVSSLAPTEDIKVVEIAASAEQVALRLQQRGRDSTAAVASRLARNADIRANVASVTSITSAPFKPHKVIINDSSLAFAGGQLASYLLATAGRATPAPADGEQHFQAP